jgi:hypothetical protein
LPLCFSSFKFLQQNVYNVSNQKSSRHDVEYSESNGLANENYLPLCFSSFELLKENHEIIEEQGNFDCIHNDIVLHEQIVINEEDQQPSHAFNDHVADYMEGYFSSNLQPVLNYQLEKENEADQEIVVKGYFPPSENNISMQQDFQQGKVFQSCLSSPENDVVVQFLSGLDMDEDSKIASMETSSCEQTNYIEFQQRNKTTYAIFQSEIHKDNEEVVVLFDSFENHGFENASMGTLDCEIVHDVIFSHLQEYYEQKLISIHSFENQNENTQANFQKINKTKSKPFDEQKDNPNAHSMDVMFKDVQGCMNVFVDMHGILDKPIGGISFVSVPKTEEIEQEQQTLMKEACLSVFAHQEEMIFNDFQDPVAILLQSSMKEDFFPFISSGFGFNFCFQLPSFTFDCLLKKDVSGEKSGSQLLDWLHWHFSITLLSIHFSSFRVGKCK